MCFWIENINTWGGTTNLSTYFCGVSLAQQFTKSFSFSSTESFFQLTIHFRVGSTALLEFVEITQQCSQKSSEAILHIFFEQNIFLIKHCYLCIFNSVIECRLLLLSPQISFNIAEVATY